MGMVEYWLLICAVLLVIYLLGNWVKLFGTEEQKAWDQYTRWSNTRLDQGATMDEVRHEYHIRHHLVELRQTVSDHVATHGKDGWEEFMGERIRLSVMVLSALDDGLGKKFLDVVSRLRHSDILYPAEFDIVYPPKPLPPVSKEESKRWARTMKAALTDLK